MEECRCLFWPDDVVRIIVAFLANVRACSQFSEGGRVADFSERLTGSVEYHRNVAHYRRVNRSWSRLAGHYVLTLRAPPRMVVEPLSLVQSFPRVRVLILEIHMDDAFSFPLSTLIRLYRQDKRLFLIKARRNPQLYSRGFSVHGAFVTIIDPVGASQWSGSFAHDAKNDYWKLAKIDCDSEGRLHAHLNDARRSDIMHLLRALSNPIAVTVGEICFEFSRLPQKATFCATSLHIKDPGSKDSFMLRHIMQPKFWIGGRLPSVSFGDVVEPSARHHYADRMPATDSEVPLR